LPHLIQARKALLEDRAGTTPCHLGATTPAGVEVLPVHGERRVVQVQDPTSLAQVLARTDLTLLDGAPLAMVNERYRLLAVAFGPAEAPSRLEIVVVLDLGSEPPSIPPDPDRAQPGWFLFDLGARPPGPGDPAR